MVRAAAAPTLLKTVFSPWRLNGLEIHNRVLMSSMHLGFEGEDMFERLARFYALRSHQGPGLMVTAGCSPTAAGRATLDGFALDRDELIDKHRLITRAVHAAGESRIALQLLHFGREAQHGHLVAPSPVRLPANLYTPRALAAEDILQTVAHYGAAARRAVEAGYDAIELLFSQGFLIHQFLSAHTNQRADAWGGSLVARMSFALQVAGAVREAVGPDFPVIHRVPCLDLLPEGLGFDDAMALIEALLPFQVDLLNISIGWHESKVPTLAHVVPPAGFAAAALRVKQRFPGLLTCASNRINDLRVAEELLLSGVADVVAMARPFLADRAIVARSQANRFDEVNACIGCNQDCLDHMFLGQDIGCSVNPACGQPEDGEAPRPLRPGVRIAVVGGGLAGMSAAWHLSRRGAEVTLFEQADQLGGQMRLAARIPGKAEFLGTIRTLEGRLRRSGAHVLLGRTFTLTDMRSRHWDHVVVATGTAPNFSALSDPLLPAAALPADSGDEPGGVRVLGWHDVLRHELPVAHPVVIYGGGGVACDLAKFFLGRPSRVAASESYLQAHRAEDLVGPLPSLPAKDQRILIAQRSSRKIGHKLGRTTRWITMSELEDHGVQMWRSAQLEGVSREGVHLRVAGEPRTVFARTLVMATGQQPRHGDLCRQLTQAGLAHTVIGAAAAHAKEPASISSSIRQGYVFATRQVDALLA